MGARRGRGRALAARQPRAGALHHRGRRGAGRVRARGHAAVLRRRPSSAAGAADSWWRFVEDSRRSADAADLCGRGDRAAAPCCATSRCPDTDVLHAVGRADQRRRPPLEVERLGSAGVCVPDNGRAADVPVRAVGAGVPAPQPSTCPRASSASAAATACPATTTRPGSRCRTQPASQAWGVSLAWPGSWEIAAEVDPTGMTRVRAGRLPHPGPLVIEPGATLITPEVALAYSAGRPRRAGPRVARLRAAHQAGERHPAAGALQLLGGNGFRRRRGRASSSWRRWPRTSAPSCSWSTTAGSPAATTTPAASATGRPTSRRSPAASARSSTTCVRSGLDFGLWVEPEAVSPKSRLYAEHPDWVYRIDGRPLDADPQPAAAGPRPRGRLEFVWSMLDGLLSTYPISYLKWDMNRPADPARPPGVSDLDAAHVRNYLRLLIRLRGSHPDVLVEACAGGGGRTDLATVALHGRGVAQRQHRAAGPTVHPGRVPARARAAPDELVGHRRAGHLRRPAALAAVPVRARHGRGAGDRRGRVQVDRRSSAPKPRAGRAVQGDPRRSCTPARCTGCRTPCST